MAPERLDGIAAPSNDIYSLGVILHQMLTGFLPAEEALISSSLPLPLEAVVQRCLAAHPEDRYSSVTDLLHDFEQACQALRTPPPPLSLNRQYYSPLRSCLLNLFTWRMRRGKLEVDQRYQ